MYHFPPLPLSEHCLCIFAVFLAQQGLKSSSISVYLSALRHLQVSAGLPAPQRSDWPRLQYVLKGIQRSQPGSSRSRLPITAAIMTKLSASCRATFSDECEARMCWAACCVGYYGFMRAGEFTTADPSSPSICVSDAAVDSHVSPTMVRITLRRAKTDPFGKGVNIFMGATGTATCPVVALLHYLAVRPKGDGPLFIHSDGSALSRDQFVRMVKRALHEANIDATSYSGHSFRIGAASMAAAAGIPAHFIKMLGRWESNAYHLYIRTPRESLTAVSSLISEGAGTHCRVQTAPR